MRQALHLCSVAALLWPWAVAEDAASYGIHSGARARAATACAASAQRCVCRSRRAGSNRISWPNGCCEGDLVVIDFRDEQADGNAGSGMLYINNTSFEPNTIENHRIEGQLGYTWKSYGPFCAYEGWHNFSYTSDTNPEETSFVVTDTFGLVKAQGGMASMPLRFYTHMPSKYCTPDGGLSAKQLKQRTANPATHCWQRCLGCARCRFVTITYRHHWLGQAYHFNTCEWHSACDLDNLMRGHVMDWTPKQKSVYTRGMTWQLR